jgi:hypothetical protein
VKPTALDIVQQYNVDAWCALRRLVGERAPGPKSWVVPRCTSHTECCASSDFGRACAARGKLDIRERARRIIEDKTGYAKLTSAEEYADAIKASKGDQALEDALYALLELHGEMPQCSGAKVKEVKSVDPKGDPQ